MERSIIDGDVTHLRRADVWSTHARQVDRQWCQLIESRDQQVYTAMHHVISATSDFRHG